MSNFQTAIQVVLAHEGGLVDNPSDPGGLTNFGISQRSYPNVDIRNLTADQASAIYLRDFWQPYGYDSIINDDCATKIFDTAVNIGNSRSFKFTQQALNTLGNNIVVGSTFGVETITALNAADPTAFLAAFRLILTNYYKGLVAAKPSLSVFLRGWLIRAQS